MDLAGWEQQYRTQEEKAASPPHPLLVDVANSLPPGRALDLACGTGHNALWLAANGWSVTAVDGSPTAVELLRRREAGLRIETQIADLEGSAFTIEPASYDLIAMCYYFQRSLVERCRQGLAPGGVMVAIALLIGAGQRALDFSTAAG